MQKAVGEYLASVRTDEAAYRNRVLREIGLCDKEYSPTGDKADGYDQFDNEAVKWYREKAITLTDEEWKAVKLAYEKQNTGKRQSGPIQTLRQGSTPESSSGNSVASLLKTFAVIIYIGGAILGFLLGRDFSGDFSFSAALVYWIAFFVAGTMMNGFSEIVRLLQIIADK